MPAVAVVMPVYNRAATVGRAIESVLAQDFQDFELVLVDDGSSDASVETIQGYRDARITLLRQERNRGGNAARNRGILTTTAPLITFLDSDDVFLPHKLGVVTRYFDERPDIDVLIDSFELVYPASSGKPPTRRINPVLERSAAIEQAIFARRLYKATPAISLRKEAVMRAGLFDESLKRRQDFDLVLRLTRTARCATTDAVLWAKQWSHDAISAKQSTFMDATIDICRRHPSYLSKPANRVGLARDIVRHFARLTVQGSIRIAASDARRFAAEFGAGTLMSLMASGSREILRRRLFKTK